MHLKKNSEIEFMFLDERKNFTMKIMYDTKLNKLDNIKIPNATFEIRSSRDDQIWCEGITSKFLKLINEFEEPRMDEKPFEVKISNLEDLKTEVKSSVKNKIKNHLSQIIIGIISSIVGGIIVLWYFTKP